MLSPGAQLVNLGLPPHLDLRLGQIPSCKLKEFLTPGYKETLLDYQELNRISEPHRLGDPLLSGTFLSNPADQFEDWFQSALKAGQLQVNAMSLATCTPDGQPSCRIVLLKEVDERGLVFFSNYDSRKGREIAANPAVALNFFWSKVLRQVRVEGRVHVLSPAESDAYFSTRPRASQLAAWASEQSQKIESRKVLTDRLAELEKNFLGKAVPRPQGWGGYRVEAKTWEFWQAGSARLHDRFLYQKEGESWKIQRLSP